MLYVTLHLSTAATLFAGFLCFLAKSEIDEAEQLLGRFSVEDDSTNGGGRRAPRNALGEPLTSRDLATGR
jgi:hypothetical protein